VSVLPDTPAGVARCTELPAGPVYALTGWTEQMPWLVHGITPGGQDMSLFGDAPVGAVLGRWRALYQVLGCERAVHARQVHGAGLLLHGDGDPGILIGPDADGHVTTRAGVLLAVSVADCVPVYVVAPHTGAVALLHGGWRGAAAGILERGIAALQRLGADPADLLVHLGPAICGACYEVGLEVPAALGLELPAATRADGGTADPELRVHVDVRAALAHRAVAAGVPPARVSVSTHCTRCGSGPFFSHRGGCAERQIAVLALRPRAP
jgi:polyphenol oxidase